jgi:hypothetical protein
LTSEGVMMFLGEREIERGCAIYRLNSGGSNKNHCSESGYDEQELKM